ncbi:hypothetical protein BJF79_17185 [Actinomadura sp. CNU-125]|nr:hypothetical protein BJF79_17185 [Actinomadura sp. CNU-125]
MDLAQEILRGSHELCDERVRVRGPGGHDDLAGLDPVERNGDQVGAQGVAPVAAGTMAMAVPSAMASILSS